MIHVKWLKKVLKHGKNWIDIIIVHNKKIRLVIWLRLHDIQVRLGVKMDYNRRSDGFIYIYGELPLKVIMNSRVPTAFKFKTKLGLNQHDLIITKEH